MYLQMDIVSSRLECKNSGKMLRVSILVWLVLQNSVHTLLLRYSRSRNVKEMFASSVAVFFTEIVKVTACILCITCQEKGFNKMLYLVKRQVFGRRSDTLRLCIFAMIYTVQNNLFYLAATNLEAATFMVTSQLKIFSTAVFAVTILKKAITWKQWLALGMLFVGVCLVQVQENERKAISSENPFLGKISFCRLKKILFETLTSA
ncbi:unnamed protein product [Gongylonema pulchrum]|uniref:UDP-galactose translocator n=1 Tax=Gongylonema pulchrum TaxID=637853 RepID=A0A183D9V6_9BILA|nr:unnamed protein product [Gongylonema pulchrum]